MDGSELRMDESSITGESDMISKISAKNLKHKTESCFILSGSKVMDGVGRELVCAVGEQT